MAYRNRDTIFSAMLALISDAWDKSVGSFIYDVLKGTAIELETAHRECEVTLDNFFLETTEDENLDLKAADYGVSRVAAAKAGGSVIVLGEGGAKIEVGDQFIADDILFDATEEVVIPNDASLAVTVNHVYNTFTTVATLLTNGTKFRVTADTFPEITGGGSLDGDTDYYIVEKTGNSFKIATERGGTAIDLKTSGSNVAIVPSDDERAVEVSVEAHEAGEAGNVPALAINGFPVALSGISEVWNPAPTEGGVDRETDESLRARALSRMRSKRTSGNKNDYIAWAEEVAGVGMARCIPLWDGAGTVKVVLFDDDYLVPSNDIVTDATAYIEERRPIGADVTVVAATGVVFDVKATVTLKSGAVEEQVKEQISEAIVAYIKQQAEAGKALAWAAICNIIYDNEWIDDYTEVKTKATGGTQSGTWGEVNITLATDEAAEFGELDLTVA